jgi:signal transduction histidine kinase
MSFAEPLLLLCVALLAGQAWRGSRRRTALNRALHEIRRPLQALALAVPRQATVGGLNAGPVWQAISAVGELDRELNGSGEGEVERETIAVRVMADACVRRARPIAELAGSRIEMRWAGTDALVRGDATSLSGALDNLLLNAVEHGGGRITLNATVVMGHVRLEVIDSGVRPRSGSVARQGRSVRRPGVRHGHGLSIAERAAAAHGGRLDTDFSLIGSTVTLVLPVECPGREPVVGDRH